MSSAIIKLNEEGVIGQLKTKWWEKERGGGACMVPEGGGGGLANLNLNNFGGIFVVLTAGLLMGAITLFIEFAWSKCFKGRKCFLFL